MNETEKMIVDWLRGFADFNEERIDELGLVESAMSMGGAAFLRKAADAIERGEHSKREKE